MRGLQSVHNPYHLSTNQKSKPELNEENRMIVTCIHRMMVRLSSSFHQQATGSSCWSVPTKTKRFQTNAWPKPWNQWNRLAWFWVVCWSSCHFLQWWTCRWQWQHERWKKAQCNNTLQPWIKNGSLKKVVCNLQQDQCFTATKTIDWNHLLSMPQAFIDMGHMEIEITSGKPFATLTP